MAVAVGLLYYLGDDEARTFLSDIRKRLRVGGRLVTMDPTFFEPQASLATFMMKRDRGQNIRTPSRYTGLTEGVFSVKCSVRKDFLRIPSTHCILECTVVQAL